MNSYPRYSLLVTRPSPASAVPPALRMNAVPNPATAPAAPRRMPNSVAAASRRGDDGGKTDRHPLDPDGKHQACQQRDLMPINRAMAEGDAHPLPAPRARAMKGIAAPISGPYTCTTQGRLWRTSALLNTAVQAIGQPRGQTESDAQPAAIAGLLDGRRIGRPGDERQRRSSASASAATLAGLLPIQRQEITATQAGEVYISTTNDGHAQQVDGVHIRDEEQRRQRRHTPAGRAIAPAARRSAPEQQQRRRGSPPALRSPVRTGDVNRWSLMRNL